MNSAWLVVTTAVAAAAAPTPTPTPCPVNFTNPAHFGAGDWPISVAVGDFNADGKKDLAVANHGSNTVSILLGDGAGHFSAATNFASGNNQTFIAVGDFNGDGKQDLAAVRATTQGQVAIFLGDGLGNFGAPTYYVAGNSPESLAVGDFNADGKQDLAVANKSSDNITILLGNGAGGFAPTFGIPVGDGPVAIVVGHFNGDGTPDLAVANMIASKVVVLLGDGTGFFSLGATLSAGSNPTSLAVGDFNSDGKQDLIAGHFSLANVSLFLGDGTGNFSTATNFAAGDGARSVAVDDFDADGNQDVAVANFDAPNVSILLSDGAGHFSPPIDFLAGDTPGPIAVGDFNGDGRPDISVANVPTDDVSILLRDCSPRPTPVINHLAVTAPCCVFQFFSFSATVKAKDQFNTTATGYTGVVHFTATCPAQLPPDSQLPNGTLTFTARLDQLGTQKITATDISDPSITGTSGPIGVAPEHVDTPTPSPTTTPSVSPSPSPTVSPSPSPTATASASPSPTASASPSPTASASPSPTASASPSPTASPSPLPSPTASASPLPTGTINPPASAQSLNLSSRLLVQTGDGVGIAGFIISGSEPKRVIVRAVHCQVCIPEISPLSDPVLELHAAGGAPPILNHNWRDTQEAEIIGTGLAPDNNSDSAMIVTLPPGNHTAILRGEDNTSGVALVEVYDLNQAAASKLANISTRAFVSTGGDILIAGFILGNGTLPDNLIIRGIGPSLGGFGVANALADPRLELRDSHGTLIRTNNNWQDDPAQAALISAAGLAPTNSLESAMAVALSPGQYTALLEGANNGTGVGLVEVYDLGNQ